MELTQLRNLLRPHIVGLKDRATHETIPQMCKELGIPVAECDGSKRARMEVSFDSVPEHDLPKVAARFLDLFPPSANSRNEIQDLLWTDVTIEIPRKSRRDIARALQNEDFYLDAKGFDELLDRLWILDTDILGILFGTSDRSLRAQIERHVHRNPGDWTMMDLFENLGAFDASNQRFSLFIEGLASCHVRPDEASQRRFAAEANKPLGNCGLELRETGLDGGYPVFTIVSRNDSSSTRPKNLIFASPEKPDLRFRDAVSNDIEIVTNADKVLVYDRPIGPEGLRWNDLQSWWSDTQGIPEPEMAKKTLFTRLSESLPTNSPPQRLFFREYHRCFGASIPGLPALLPEVWLHWDHKTVAERGAQALQRFRMDFLLLLPHGIRVVVEVDGKHHYSTDGVASSALYAKMAAADRDLKLAGYHVFRFGAEELQIEGGPGIVGEFFSSLFKRFGVLYSVP